MAKKIKEFSYIFIKCEFKEMIMREKIEFDSVQKENICSILYFKLDN